MIVVDACLFAGEAAMLELRFLTLAGYVDRFIVVACTLTHQGQPIDEERIERAFHESRDATGAPARLFWIRPSRVLDRGQGVLLERAPDERGPAGSRFFQHIERQHRNGMAAAVLNANLDPSDIVLMSDVDEIPHPPAVAEAVDDLTARRRWLCLAQRFHSGSLAYLHPQQPWWGTCIARADDVRPQAHRDARTTIGSANPACFWIPHGGWHFSWFGTDDERAEKLNTFSHAELLGRYDPGLGRLTGHHANGETLYHLTLAESEMLDWPAPLTGMFPWPEHWHQEWRSADAE